jgi:hypothetical protein
MPEKAQAQVRRVTTHPHEAMAPGCWSTGSDHGDSPRPRPPSTSGAREVAPSTELRKWYSHDSSRFIEFARRYQVELTQPERSDALAHLRKLMKHRTLTLLTSTKQRPGHGRSHLL